MAILPLGGPQWIVPMTGGQPRSRINESTVNLTVDAALESVTMIGYLSLSSGPGTSATLDTGGKIWWQAGAITFANAGTNFRIGIQDVDAATGLEDGTWTSEPQVDLTGGGGGITASALNGTTIGSGSRSLSHGSLYAISFEMTTRGGADSVIVVASAAVMNLSYITADTGSGPAKITNASPSVMIEFGNGVIGYFDGMASIPLAAPTTTSFNSTSTPDEYGMMFTPPVDMQIDALLFHFGEVDSGETADLLLISDPMGTPSTIETITIDPDLLASGTGTIYPNMYLLSSARTLTGGTAYAICYRATSAGARLMQTIALPIAAARLAAFFGTTMKGLTRSDAGAFTDSTTVMPVAGMRVIGIQDPAGAGGGGAHRGHAGPYGLSGVRIG